MNQRISRTVLTLLAVGLLQASPAAVAQSHGVKVHGHWTIDIREPGGALVTHREFENALTEAGGTSLATFLSRSSVPGLWRVSLLAESRLPCARSGSIPDQCFIVELNDPSATGNTNVFPNLAVARTLSSLVLMGTATAASAGDIDFVTTAVGVCPSAPSPQPCDQSHLFTSTRIKDPLTGSFTPIPVTAAGQIIQVKVVISFQ
jgi:hypothetical protein